MKLLNLLFIFIATSTICAQNNSDEKYFRHLRYNHVSPYIQLVGTHPIDKSEAPSTSHYVFTYDSSGRLVQIINNHYHTERRHPLASIGVYRMSISYSDMDEIRVFYDINNKRITNDREVYKEVFSYDKDGFKYQLVFYDIENKRMESSWKVSEYRWKKHQKFIVEERFNLAGEAVNVSPYFEFGTTGILLDKNDVPKGHYNLDANFKPKANSVGVASYQDTYDAHLNHVKYSYHDEKDDLVMNQWGFAYGEKVYDSIGNQIGLNQFDVEGKEINRRNIYSNATIVTAEVASQQDSLDIRKKSLGYLVALQKMKPELMNEVMNDSLNKVTIGYDRNLKAEYANATTREDMMRFAESWNKANTKFPFKPNNQIKILDIYDRIANVKLVSDNWVEYLHLIRLDGNWQIVNLIWQYKDVERYPKR